MKKQFVILFIFLFLSGCVTGRKDVGQLKNGKKEGSWVQYHENGQLKHKWNYKDRKKDGENIHYWENGQLWVKENYKDGKKEGETLVYNENGQFEKTKIYKDGKLIETIKH